MISVENVIQFPIETKLSTDLPCLLNNYFNRCDKITNDTYLEPKEIICVKIV